MTTKDRAIVILDGGRRTPRADILVDNSKPGLFSRYSATQPEYGPAGVRAGAHTRQVLREIGYADDEIDEFEKTGLFK